MTRVLLTGATGFIGSQIARALVEQGCEVHALVRPSTEGARGLFRLDDIVSKLVIHLGDLTDATSVAAAVTLARPELCVHSAWYAAPGKYLHAVENLALVEATLDLARRLGDSGCRRLVGLGTCFEYDTSLGYLSEASPTLPLSLYAASKLGVFHILQKFAEISKMSFAWARLFYQYGPLEPEGRLTSHLMGSLLRGETADVTAGEQVRDFLHVSDVASAICAIATGHVTGAVNVGCGVPITVRQLVTTLGRLCGASDKIRFGAIPYRANDPMFVCANNAKLLATGWRPRFDLDSGLLHTMDAWRKVSR